MANVVFDKHVIFCEAYIKEVNATAVTLFREHATKKAVEHANKLYTLRVEHGAWVTKEMSADLETFEDALRKLGAKAGYVADTSGSAGDAEQRKKAIEYVFKEFDRIMPHLANVEAEEGVAIETVVARVRGMLGIEKLVDLRAQLISKAHKALQ